MKLVYMLFILAFSSIAAFAEGSAVVKYQYVMQKSQAYNSLLKQAGENQKAFEAIAKKEEEVLQKAEKDLLAKKAEYSEVDFNKKVAEWRTKAESANNKLQEKQAELQKNNEAAMKTIEEQFRKIITALVKENSYEMVYLAESLAYYSEKSDMSEEVLKRLDKALPKISLKKVS